MPKIKNDLKDLVEQSEADALQQPKSSDVEVKLSPNSAKRHIGGHFSENVYKQMKHLGIEKDMTMQQMLTDALNALFRLHDKPPIA